MPEFRLQIINSNDISVLAAACATIMRSSPLKSPLGKEKILILNSGMKNYLSEYIASANGIAAGADYMQLWEFIWQAYKDVCGSTVRDNPFDRDAVTWSLMAMAGSWGGRAITRPLARYIDVPKADEPDLRLYELCSKIADTFDQYQMYRPEWILKWDELDEGDFAKWEQFKEGRSHDEGRVGQALRAMVPRRLRPKDGSIPKQVLSNDWQPYLWSCLRPNMHDYSGKEAGGDDASRFFDRPQVIRAFIDKLMNHADEAARVLPERIFVAGVSSLPGQVIDLLAALGLCTEVYVLFLNPCRDYWGDLRCGRSPRLYGSQELRNRILKADPALKGRGLAEASQDDPPFTQGTGDDSEDEVTDGFSPLLSASGREARDMLSSLCSLPEDRLSNMCNVFADPEGPDALSQVKAGMYSLDASRRPGSEGKAKAPLKEGDSSLVFVSCHTRRREVEELRDLMLEKFERAKTQGERLDPGDMLVMTPAIEEYAPDIEAVFGSVDEDDPSRIPYSISDRQVTRQDPAADAVLRIMGAGEEPVTVGFVLSLLAVPEIARTFGFADEDLDVISKWCIGTGIHWGLDDREVREDLADGLEGDGGQVPKLPWTFDGGISRLLEGFMQGRGERGGNYTEVEGSDAAIAGKFWHFVKCLKEVRAVFEDLGAQDCGMFSEDPAEGREGERPMRFERLQQILLDRFIGSSPDEGRKFKDVLWGLSRVPGMLKNAPQVSLRVLRAMLSDSLEHKVDEGRFLAGKVNFCSMLPMRAVPFKHIFILGLNDGDFPRAERAPGFNLLALPQFFRRGDRSRPSDDRYLFLEAILSARESLTLSYIGQNPSDGSAMEPSPVITELREWLDDNLEAQGGARPSEVLTIKSRLNAYDPGNYDKQARAAQGVPRLPSFDQRSYVDKDGAAASDGKAPGLAQSYGQALPASLSVTPEDLATFLRSPCRGFLKHAGVSAIRDEDEPEDAELFDFDRLQGGSLKGEILWLGDNQARAELDGREASGLCPGGAFWERQKQQILDFHDEVRKALESAAPGIDFANAEERLFDSASGETISFTAQDLRLEGDEAASFAGAAASLAGSARQYDAKINPYSGELPIINAMCAGIAQALAFDDGEHALWLGGSGSEIVRFKPFTRIEARAALRDCLRYYLMGLMRPLPVWPDLFKGAGRYDLGVFLGTISASKSSQKQKSYKAPGFAFDQDAAFLFQDSAVCNARKGGPEGPGFPLLKAFYEDVVYKHAIAHLEDQK